MSAPARQRRRGESTNEAVAAPSKSIIAEGRQLWIEANEQEMLTAALRRYTAFFARLRAVEGTDAFDYDECWLADAREKFALLLLHTRRDTAVARELGNLGCVARVSKNVLRYALPPQPSTDSRAAKPERYPGSVLDNALPKQTFDALCQAFLPTDAPYWTEHDYSVEPPSPFFSYLIPLDEAPAMGAIGQLALAVKRLAMVEYPELAAKGKCVELWAHNRPHATGHQLHFDSDDEGRDGIRNPLLGSIFFLAEDAGGPTLMTGQRMTDRFMSEEGWLVFPKKNRLTIFDGTRLHGVVPGRGVAKEGARRVTAMAALWADIKTRHATTPGAARPMPEPDHDKHGKWVRQLFAPAPHDETDTLTPTPKAEAALPVYPVFEAADGTAWPKTRPMPAYDRVFQGM